ncbi:hypothetical protein D9757_006730 [Collybiopsis confluens]|uniref:Thaumatin-like protein n=1 Tax=Collybiopsis confluens TaxID=2823264 RepID=A0A8H5HLN4_9AGAR|nr:hypothetical protein D9757_006730 [Collybiopsis confluens]
MWPAMFTGVGARPSFTTGWEAGAFTSVSFSVPDDWTAGRIWALNSTATSYIPILKSVIWFCPPTESNCPDSYAYAFDESSGTALWTCSNIAADYTVTFCP